jgi:type IV pilus assembly protein PilB
LAKQLGEMLLQEGLITSQTLQQALQEQKSSKRFLGEVLISMKALTEKQLVDALARQPGISSVDLAKVNFAPELAKVIPHSVASKRGCIPLQITGNMLQVGMLDPLDDRTINMLNQQSGRTIQPVAISPAAFPDALRRLYGNSAEAGASADDPKREIPSGPEIDQLVEHVMQEVSDAEIAKDGGKKTAEAIRLEIEPTDPPVIRLANAILLKCVQTGASDIHIEPQEHVLRVRYRVDGTLHQFYEIPKTMCSALTSRFKIMSSMDVAEHRIPQDGRIKLSLGGGTSIDFRINTLPGVHGEKLVARILGTGMLKGRVADLGFANENLELVENSLKSHFGMILVTGPTGSGKTTTLYTMLNQVNDEAVNIVTAEDPVEYNLPGLHQVNIHAAIGFTFDTALRSFLRQDPDIILVGEMRDYETAAIAVKAALTGHLVLSTLHTNDAPSTVVRLIDMGIEPYLVASAVKLVIAQRLVRKICSNCHEERPLAELDKLDLPTDLLENIERICQGRGCEKCNGLGNKGRLPLFEVMAVKSAEMRRVITEGGTEVQVSQVARKEGMVSLRENALTQVNKGVINIEEAVKIALSD